MEIAGEDDTEYDTGDDDNQTVDNPQEGISCQDSIFARELVRRGILARDLPSTWKQLSRLSTSRFERHLLLTKNFFHLALNAGNKATFVAGLVHSVVDLTSLLLDCRLGAILNAQWNNKESLPCPSGTMHELQPPCPDLTVGFSDVDFPFTIALDRLEAYALLVVCMPSLIFPFYALEAKYLEVHDHAYKANQHTGALMLRNLRQLHLSATSEEDCRRVFDDRPLVFTASITQELLRFVPTGRI